MVRNIRKRKIDIKRIKDINLILMLNYDIFVPNFIYILIY
jgi:hypothetical protein